jgi:hypothetical protein
MPAIVSTARVAVLGDHPVLCEAIKMGLRHRFPLEPVQLPVDGSFCGDLDLMVLVALSPDSAPAEMLARASLYRLLGRIPLLIVSEGSLELVPAVEWVYHLEFPFTYDELYSRTAGILSGMPEQARRGEAIW